MIEIYIFYIPGMKSTRIPSLRKLMTILIIPAKRPRLAATSEGVILGLLLTNELTTELIRSETVAKKKKKMIH